MEIVPSVATLQKCHLSKTNNLTLNMPYIFLLQFPVCLKNVAEWATYLGEPRFKSWPGDRLY